MGLVKKFKKLLKAEPAPRIAVAPIAAFEHAADTSFDMQVIRMRQSLMVVRNRGGAVTTYSFTEQEARALVALLGEVLG